MVEELAENNNQLNQARTCVVEYIKNLEVEAEQLDESSNPLVLQFLAELNNILSGLASRDQYRTYGSSYMKMKVRSHVQQRCVDGSREGVSTNPYVSGRKMMMAMRLSSAKSNK
eukprot:274863_1